MFIRTQRLFLRPVWAEDWSDILTIAGNEAVARNLSRLPWPYGEAEARAFAARPQDPRLPHFLITHPLGKGGVEVLGCVGLADAGAGMAELGVWIAAPHWGHGYASEAGRAVLGLAGMLGHRRLEAAHFLDNPASGRMLRKLGFRPTGEIVTRLAPARGGTALAQVLAIDLAAGGDDGGDADGGDMLPRAA